jgi:hypothetical protein
MRRTLNPSQKTPHGLRRIKNRDVHQQCDGCRKSHPPSGLVPVGVGSIQVCARCYSAATAMVFTQKDLYALLKSGMKPKIDHLEG